MDNTDLLKNGQNNGSSPIKSNSPNKTLARSPENITNETYKGVGTILNPPPPHLPGVFVFDPPGHQLNISSAGSDFIQSSKTVNTSYSESVNNYTESVPVSYNSSKFNTTNVNVINASADIFQCSNINIYDYPLPHEEKGLKSLQPVLQSNVDDVLSSDGSVYQSLQPVAHNLFDVSTDSNSKVFQQLESPSENEYRLNEESCSGVKYYQQLHPLHVESRFQNEEEPKVYQQLKPVIPTGETKTIHHLKPVAPTIDPPPYVNSKLYQQLSQPSTRGSKIEYHSDSKLYHQLRPVTVSDFESRSSRYDPTAKNTYQNAPITTTSSTINPYFPTHNVEQIQNNKSNFQELKNIPGVSHPPQSRIASFNLEDRLIQKNSQRVFPLNKPKVYLELRHPTLRQETTGSYQTGCIEGNPYYSGISQKFNNHHSSSPNRNNQYQVEIQSRTCEKSPTNIQTNEIITNPFRLPSPHEFNLPKNSTTNKYKLPRILGPNEYNTPQNIVKSEKKVSESLKSSLEPKFLSSSAKTFTDYLPKSNSTCGKLSLPKSPVCYGDSNAKSERRNHPAASLENDQTQLINAIRSTESSSSAVPVNHLLVKSNINNLNPSLEYSSKDLKKTNKNENYIRTSISINNSAGLNNVGNLNPKIISDKLSATQNVISENCKSPLIGKEGKSSESNQLIIDKEGKIITTSNSQLSFTESLKSSLHVKPTERSYLDGVILTGNNINDSTSKLNLVGKVELNTKLVQSKDIVSNYPKSQHNNGTLHTTIQNSTVSPQLHPLHTKCSQIDDECLSSREQACVKNMKPGVHQSNIVDLDKSDKKLLLNQNKGNPKLISDPIVTGPCLDFRNNDIHSVKNDYKNSVNLNTDLNAKCVEKETTFIHKSNDGKHIAKEDSNLILDNSSQSKIEDYQTSKFVTKKFRKSMSFQTINNSSSSYSSLESGVVEENNDHQPQNKNGTFDLSLTANLEAKGLNDYGSYRSKRQYKSYNVKSQEYFIKLDKRRPGRPIKRKRGRPRKIIDQSNNIHTTNVCLIKSDMELENPIKRKRGRPPKNSIHNIAYYDKNINVSYGVRNTDPSSFKRKRGRPRKYFKPENSVDENISRESSSLTNTGGIIRQKRKYTKRFLKESFEEANSDPLKRSKRKYVKRKRFPMELGVDDKGTKNCYSNWPSSPEVKHELLDPLEEGLISDDDGDVVFLGFDMDNGDDEDDTILGFDLSQSGDDQDQFHLNYWMPINQNCE